MIKYQKNFGMVVSDAIDRLLEAIDYPSGEVSPDGGGGVVLKVDDAEMRVREENGRLTLVCPLERPDEVRLAQLAGYAAGRLLKEDAALAWDPERDELIVWQAVSATADAALMRRVFEVFALSCDWWRDRAGGVTSARAAIPEMMIRP